MRPKHPILGGFASGFNSFETRLWVGARGGHPPGDEEPAVFALFSPTAAPPADRREDTIAAEKEKRGQEGDSSFWPASLCLSRVATPHDSAHLPPPSFPRRAPSSLLSNRAETARAPPPRPPHARLSPQRRPLAVHGAARDAALLLRRGAAGGVVGHRQRQPELASDRRPAGGRGREPGEHSLAGKACLEAVGAWKGESDPRGDFPAAPQERWGVDCRSPKGALEVHRFIPHPGFSHGTKNPNPPLEMPLNMCKKPFTIS